MEGIGDDEAVDRDFMLHSYSISVFQLKTWELKMLDTK